MQGPKNFHRMTTERTADPRRVLTTVQIRPPGGFSDFSFWIGFCSGLFPDANKSSFRARSVFEGIFTPASVQGPGVFRVSILWELLSFGQNKNCDLEISHPFSETCIFSWKTTLRRLGIQLLEQSPIWNSSVNLFQRRHRSASPLKSQNYLSLSVCIVALLIRQEKSIFSALYCHLSSVYLYHTFPHYITNGKIFGKQNTEHKMCLDSVFNVCLKHFPFQD